MIGPAWISLFARHPFITAASSSQWDRSWMMDDGRGGMEGFASRFSDLRAPGASSLGLRASGRVRIELVVVVASWWVIGDRAVDLLKLNVERRGACWGVGEARTRVDGARVER